MTNKKYFSHFDMHIDTYYLIGVLCSKTIDKMHH